MISHFVIDPPWPKRKGGIRKVRPNQTRELDYQTMPVADIFGLLDREVLPLAATPHNVFLWTVDDFLHPAEQQMESLGYRKHARIIWDKENGVAPAFTVRYTHEYLIWYYRPKLQPVAREMRGKFGTVLREGNRQHSRKPSSAYAMIDALYPAGERMDVFSREARAGWQQWGNQVNHFSPTSTAA